MTPLCALAIKHKTDKFWPHDYTPVYFERLAGRVETTRKLLEVGIGKRGASLRMWEEFFPAARIYGIDFIPEYLINQGRIASFQGDQSTPEQLVAIATKAGPVFDVIIDDGAHDIGRQIGTIRALLPFLAADGIWFTEDVKDSIGPLIDAVPVGFAAEIFEGAKLLPSGRGERMLIVQKRRVVLA